MHETNRKREKDAFNKIIKCIKSCETEDQLKNCLNMIDLFDKLYKCVIFTAFLQGYLCSAKSHKFGINISM